MIVGNNRSLLFFFEIGTDFFEIGTDFFEIGTDFLSTTSCNFS